MHKIITSIFLLSFIFTAQVNGQIFDKLSKSIDKAADDLTDKISAQMVERIFERIFSGEMTAEDSTSISSTQKKPSGDSSTASSPSIDLSSIFGGSKVDKTKVFNFSHRMKMEIESNDQKNIFDYYFNTDETYLGAKMSDMLVVIDMETGKTYTIMNGSLITFNMSSVIEKMAPKGLDDEEKYTVTRTGKRQTIAGFDCEEIIMENDENIITGWLTQNFINPKLEEVAFIQKIRDSTTNEEMSGAFMKYTHVEKGKEEQKTTMTVTEFVPESKTINLADY